MGADHRAFLEATLPHLDVVYQVARRAAGDGRLVAAAELPVWFASCED